MVLSSWAYCGFHQKTKHRCLQRATALNSKGVWLWWGWGGTIGRELPAPGRYCASGIKTAWYTFCAPSEKRSWNLMKGGNPTLIPLCTVGEECGNEKPSDLTKAMWRVCSRVRSRPKLSAARSGHQNDASFVWLWTQMWAVVCEPCCPCVLIQTHSSPLSVPIKSVFWPQWPEVG